MRIERIPVSKINPAAYNPRKELKPGDPEYEALQRSLDRWGLVEPLVWNRRTGNLVGGHQRLRILLAQGATEVEVSVVDLEPDDEKALNLALNKIQGEWDQLKLEDVLRELDMHGFDLDLTGFTEREVEEILAGVQPQLGSLADLADYENRPTEVVNIVVRAGEGEELRARLRAIAKECPDPDEIAPMGWALEQVITAYEQARLGRGELR